MWYSLKFSTAMNRLQTGWVILMAASTTKRGPLRFSLVFLVKLGFTSNFIQQGVATVATFALSFSQHSCRDSFGRRSAKCSWPAGVANARRVPRWNSFFLCLSVLLFGVQESTVISKFIYIYKFGAKSSGDVATMLGCFSGSKSTLSCILQSSHFMHSTMSKWYGVGHETEKDYDHDQQVNLTSTSAWIIRVMGSMVCFCCQSCHRIINP